MKSLITVCAVCAIAAGGALAGDLNPPPGPVVETMKPLDEVEPRVAINAANTPGDGDSVFKIVAPGSYYLTENFFAGANRHGIEIATSSVTIDLNGFTLQGSGSSKVGVYAPPNLDLTNIVVRDGIVRSFGEGGVELNALGCAVEDVAVFFCGGRGVEVSGDSRVLRCTTQTCEFGIRAGSGVIVRDCIVIDSSNIGIAVSGRGTVENCVTRSNNGTGYQLGSEMVVRGCVSWNDEGQAGILVNDGIVVDCTVTMAEGDGISFTDRGIVERCRVDFCGGDGITGSASLVVRDSVVERALNGISAVQGELTAENCLVVNVTGDGYRCFGIMRAAGCVARFTQENGFLSGSDSVLRDCVSESAQDNAFFMEDRVSLIDCRAQQPGGDAFFAGIDSTFDRCVASDGGGHAFAAGARSSYRECSAFNFGNGAGFLLVGESVVVGGAAHDNEFGAWSVSGINRIDGVELVTNNIGARLDSPSNVLVRSTFRGNSAATSGVMLSSQFAGPFLATPTDVMNNTNPLANIAQ